MPTTINQLRVRRKWAKSRAEPYSLTEFLNCSVTNMMDICLAAFGEAVRRRTQCFCSEAAVNEGMPVLVRDRIHRLTPGEAQSCDFPWFSVG